MQILGFFRRDLSLIILINNQTEKTINNSINHQANYAVYSQKIP